MRLTHNFLDIVEAADRLLEQIEKIGTSKMRKASKVKSKSSGSSKRQRREREEDEEEEEKEDADEDDIDVIHPPDKGPNRKDPKDDGKSSLEIILGGRGE